MWVNTVTTEMNEGRVSLCTLGLCRSSPSRPVTRAAAPHPSSTQRPAAVYRAAPRKQRENSSLVSADCLWCGHRVPSRLATWTAVLCRNSGDNWGFAGGLFLSAHLLFFSFLSTPGTHFQFHSLLHTVDSGFNFLKESAPSLSIIVRPVGLQTAGRGLRARGDSVCAHICTLTPSVVAYELGRELRKSLSSCKERHLCDSRLRCSVWGMGNFPEDTIL